MSSFSSLVRYSFLHQKYFLWNLSNQITSTDFEKAKANLESLSVEVDNETKFKLYALYKQSTKSVCSTSKPRLTNFIGHDKWTAWSALGKMTQQDA